MKKLFLDSANLREIEDIMSSSVVAGVTTNPSLMAKESRGDYVVKLREIATLISCLFSLSKKTRYHLSVEVMTSDPSKMFAEAVKLYEEISFPGIDLHIKIPLLFETLPIITKLGQNKVCVNATAVMTTLQAKMAEDAGASVISFFYNRMLDVGENAVKEIRNYTGYLRNNGGLEFSPHVICGSIRKSIDVFDCWSAGADFVTAPSKVIREMVYHAQTDAAVIQFQKDIDSWRS